jgi:hypothetical protein
MFAVSQNVRVASTPIYDSWSSDIRSWCGHDIWGILLLALWWTERQRGQQLVPSMKIQQRIMSTRMSYKFNNVSVLAGVSLKEFIGCHFDALSEVIRSYYSLMPVSFCIVTIAIGSVACSGGFETLMPVTMKNSIFRDIRRLKTNRHFGRTCRWRVSQTRNQHEACNKRWNTRCYNPEDRF